MSFHSASATEPATIERICGGGNARPEGYTDSKGRFSIELGRNMGVMQDASVSTADPMNRTFTLVDNGGGMRRRELARYHDIAASTKTRGEGIGFAGVGRVHNVFMYSTSARFCSSASVVP